MLALVAALGMAVVGAAAPAVAAVPAVHFSFAYYNSPGSDTGSNASLNAEYVRVHNSASTSRSLTGWTIRDAQGHVYRFGTYTLRAGTSVTLHTGRGSNTASNRYWGRSWYVWNNTGDRAILRNSSGTTIDTCSWGGSGSSTGC